MYTMIKYLDKTLIVLLLSVCSTMMAQSGLYIPSAKPVKNIERALKNPEQFCLLIAYNGGSSEFDVKALDLLDSAYRIAFDRHNPMYYTMTIEGYGTENEGISRERVERVYRYFAMRSHADFPVRYALNTIHCSCHGDTVELLRYEVPTSKLTYNTAELPEARRTLNKTIDLRNTVLVTFRNDPDECLGGARGCAVPAEDSVVHGYYASLFIARGAIHSVDGTKDTCPNNVKIRIEDHLDYRAVVEQYHLVPHRKQIIAQAGYIVISGEWPIVPDSCSEPLKDSIFIRIPATQEQIDSKLKFFAKVKTSRGMEYKSLPTRKLPSKTELVLQAPINVGQFDTIYVGKRLQEKEVAKYFYRVDGPTEAAAFPVAGHYYVAYRLGRNGDMELKKPLRMLFRITPDQEDEVPDTKKQLDNPEEIIE